MWTDWQSHSAASAEPPRWGTETQSSQRWPLAMSWISRFWSFFINAKLWAKTSNSTVTLPEIMLINAWRKHWIWCPVSSGCFCPSHWCETKVVKKCGCHSLSNFCVWRSSWQGRGPLIVSMSFTFKTHIGQGGSPPCLQSALAEQHGISFNSWILKNPLNNSSWGSQSIAAAWYN